MPLLQHNALLDIHYLGVDSLRVEVVSYCYLAPIRGVGQVLELSIKGLQDSTRPCRLMIAAGTRSRIALQSEI